jgi:RES domain-containing protein
VDVDAIAVTGDWIRHAPHASGLSGPAGEPTAGRWQHAAVVRALHLADEPATAVAEWYRWLAERGLPLAYAIPHDHHVWRLDLQLANLGSVERLAAVGLTAPRPSRRTWPAFQAVGDALCELGWRGLVAPSAARPQSLIVCVFDRGEWPPAGCEPVRAIAVPEAPPPPTGMTT